MDIKSIFKHIQLVVLAVLVVILGYAIIKPKLDTDDKISAALYKNDVVKHAGPTNTPTVPALSPIKHVFVIFEENKDWKRIYNNTDAAYLNSLLTKGAHAENYHNIPVSLGGLHPSQPNYIMATAGKIAFSDHVFDSNNLPDSTNSTASQDHLIYLLAKNNLTWKSYQEDISGVDCPVTKVANYSPKHNPFVYYKDIAGNPPNPNNTYCRAHIRPLSELQNDLSTGKAVNYNFITPNLQNDMHDGSIKQADEWLANIIPMITESSAYKDSGAIFITWDESEGDKDENNPIGMIILSPFVKQGYSNSLEYSHASLLKTVEEIFNLTPLLGYAGDIKTNSLSDFFEIK